MIVSFIETIGKRRMLSLVRRQWWWCVLARMSRALAEALDFARTHEACFAIVGIHPHDTKDDNAEEIRGLVEPPWWNRGGCIVRPDYFYSHSPKEVQQEALRQQLQIAIDYDLPVSFHVRNAFEDFLADTDEFPRIRGVLIVLLILRRILLRRNGAACILV